MKKTIIEEYDSSGKLIKRTTIEEDTNKINGVYNPYNPIVWQPGVRGPLTIGKEYLDKTITCQADSAPKATLKGE